MDLGRYSLQDQQSNAHVGNSLGKTSSRESRREESATPRPRRSHRKSRLGCIVCKARRIKCDETKPSCNRCRIYGVECVYFPEIQRNQELRLRTRDVSPAADHYSMSLASTAENITSLLQSAAATGMTSTCIEIGSALSRENLEALARFELFTCHTLGSPIVRHVIRNKVLRLGFTSPHLMHTLIATSITHLQWLVPTYTPKTLSAAHHWQRAISLFRQELNSSRQREKDDIDSLISTCMLLAVYYFTVDDHSLEASWIFSSEPGSERKGLFADWLFFDGGLEYLFAKVRGFPENSIWLPVIKDSDDHRGTFSNIKPGIQGIPTPFVDLCELDETSTPDNNAYHAPLRILSALLMLDVSSAAYTKVVTFLGTITGRYRELLLQKEPKALLILAYWLALMCRVDQWWVQNRARIECQAICMYLEHLGDRRIIELLELPALMCGYQLLSRAPVGIDGYGHDVNIEWSDLSTYLDRI
ncbi:hypothetical protein VTO42DRAFT_3281 [Malbranchea cinnamomea]